MSCSRDQWESEFGSTIDNLKRAAHENGVSLPPDNMGFCFGFERYLSGDIPDAKILERLFPQLHAIDFLCRTLFESRISELVSVERREEEKDPDDLTPPTKRNVSYEELKKTWMAKMNENCIFISAKNRDNYQEFRDLLYKEIRDMHAIRYPYDNFLY